MANSHHKILLILPMMLVLTIPIAITEIFAQPGSMATLQNIDATYAVSIVPGAAQKENIYHYYPPKIAIPIGTTIAWFNNDFGQPHTVTSGQPGAADRGSVFHSGVMPATANSFFQYNFNQAGEFLYHCIIHPWRVASVTASDAFFTGQGFKIDIGSGGAWDINTHPRVLLDIEPQTIPLDRTTPITYNVTINEGQENNNTLFSGLFTTAGQSLPLELIASAAEGSNETISYGPDFSSTGAYHVQSNFKKDSSYPISIEIVSVNSKPVESPMKVLFDFKTT
jgi:plastocyanin